MNLYFNIESILNFLFQKSMPILIFHFILAKCLGPLHTRSQDHEIPGPNNSILNLTIGLEKVLY
jgi:hypothetical protein